MIHENDIRHWRYVPYLSCTVWRGTYLHRTQALLVCISITSRRNGRRNAPLPREKWETMCRVDSCSNQRMQCALVAAGGGANLDASWCSNELLAMNLRGRQSGLSAWLVSNSMKNCVRGKTIYAASLARFQLFA